MARSSAVAVALVVTGYSVAAFVAPFSRPTAPVGVKWEGGTCTALPQHHKQRGHGKVTGPLQGVRTSTITLPQDPDANTKHREERVAEAQAVYNWNSTRQPIGVPYLDEVPDAEMPSQEWSDMLDAEMKTILIGTFRGKLKGLEISGSVSDLRQAKIFAKKINEKINIGRKYKRPDSIEDYDNMHSLPIKNPDSVNDYEADETFARLRLQGHNCVTIERCSQATRDKLKILDAEDPDYEELRRKVDGLMDANKLLAVDQELLKNHEADPLDDVVDRYLTASIALFEVTDDDLHPIKVIGIQLGQGEDEVTPIFTPTDGYNWMIVKTCFEAADFIIHEVVSHLGNTHLVLEGALVGMHRTLPAEHPIYALLHPHLEGTAYINMGAQDMLLVEKGGVDRLAANKISDCWDLATTQTLERLSKDFSPEADFKNRSMTTEDFPGRYMYRDVGLRYWEATHTWVKAYLSAYYADDAAVELDSELMAFVEEMRTKGKVGWLDEFSTSDDKLGFIAKVIASYIYSASTLHAAVNFPQQSIMSYNPSNPGSVYQPPPTDKDLKTFEDYLAYLPSLGIATVQVVLGTLLGSIYYTTLGEYDEDQFGDDENDPAYEAVQDALATFKTKIADIETDLVNMNSEMVSLATAEGKPKNVANNYAYETLLPANIPQSINI